MAIKLSEASRTKWPPRHLDMSFRQGLRPPLSCEPTAYTSQDGWKWLCPGLASKPSRAAVCMRVGRWVFMLKVTACTVRLLPTGTSGAESPDSLFTAALMAAAGPAGPLARPDKLEAPPSELAASDAVALHSQQARHASPRNIASSLKCSNAHAA